MDTQNPTLEVNRNLDKEIQNSRERQENNHEQYVSDGSELIPAVVAQKDLQDREKPLTPHSEMLAKEGKSKHNFSSSAQPAYRVTDTGLINAYPVSPPMSKVDPLGKKQLNRYIIGFGLAANALLGLVVLSRFISTQI